MFEKKFEELFSGNATKAISCGSGTDALHLAYILAGVARLDFTLIQKSYFYHNSD